MNLLERCPECDLFKVNCQCVRTFKTTCGECGGSGRVMRYRNNGHNEPEEVWYACDRCQMSGWMVVEVPLWTP